MPRLQDRLRARRGQRGAAAVEFALVSLVLITLLLGIIDFGWAINRDTMINNAAREGAREASLNPKTSDITAVVNDRLKSLTSSDITIAVTCRKPGSAGCAMASNVASGDVVSVKVDYKYRWITPIGQTFGSYLGLSKSAEMRVE